MVIRIDLLVALKIYLLGSLISLLIVVFHKEIENTKHNFLLAFIWSWFLIPCMIKDYIVSKIDYFLDNKIKTDYNKLYLYCVLKSYIHGRFKKYYILEDYFSIKFKQKHKSVCYKKDYFTGEWYWDANMNAWDSYYNMAKFYFINKYNK